MSRKILCATDGSEHSSRAVEFAAELAKQNGGALVYLTINPVLLTRGTRSLLLDEKTVRNALDAAADVAKKAGVKNVECVEHSARDIGSAIVAYAEEHGVDQIVVGSGGKGTTSRLFIGSVSNEVVNKAHCPVTVVR